MKQTTVILTALCLSLLVISGIVVAGYAQQDALLEQKSSLLSALTKKNEELTVQLQKATNIRDDLEASLTAERQAASRHSAEVDAAAAQRAALEEECSVLRTALDRANRECAELRTQVDSLQLNLTKTQEEAAQAALISEQQAQEASETIAALAEQNQTLRQNALPPPSAPTPVPLPTP